MAKKLVALVVAVLTLFSCTTAFALSEKKAYTAAEVTETGTKLLRDGEYFTVEKAQGWFGIKNVDLTGVKSIGLTGKNKMHNSSNSEIFRIKIDDPMAESVGFIAFNQTAEGDTDVTAYGNIEAASGVHNLYFVATLTKNIPEWSIKKITLHTEAVERVGVSDDFIVDDWSDTWSVVDDYGRKVADYEEVGPVKEGEHAVGMMYWDWHSSPDINYNIVVPEVIKKAPEARYDVFHEGWYNYNNASKVWWSEPVYGFYTSQDFWVYKKQFTLLSNAGVDAIFLDYTNGGNTYTEALLVLMEALLECKKEGLDIPKISWYGTMGAYSGNAYDETVAFYYNVWGDERYRDLWFTWEGKPFAVSHSTKIQNQAGINKNDEDIVKLQDTLEELINLRHMGSRGKPSDGEDLTWLETYPQFNRGKQRADGRVESITVGVAVNDSTVYGSTRTGVFSDPYAKGRGFSEVFGEDYSADNGRKPYFFREQAALALDVDPAFIYIDGWNEWTTYKYETYGDYKAAFVDLFDEENSRDFEPSRSYIKDDYYNLLVDFVRKYKGVRPAPVASEPVTINVAGDVSQWDSVAPEFINNYTDYERDAYGIMDVVTNERLHYTAKVNNTISRAKVARDANNLYFMAKTDRATKEGGEGFMNLYINTDRNYATGWAGYDFAINKNGKGTVAKYENGAWVTVGNAEVAISDNVMQLSVARALLGVAGTVDLEFKWTDGVVTDDYLDFYDKGSVAPTGKFNYLYTEIAQVSLSDAERKALKGTSVLKAGNNKMVVSGGKMGVYERDTRITPFESNGTLYVPAETFEELLGYGLSKVSYDAEQNMLYLSRHDLSDDRREITNYIWTYTVLGSTEVRANGRAKTLSAPAAVIDGIIYVPLTYVSEAFGLSYKSLGNGAYAISYKTISDSAVTAALGIMG